VAIGDVGLRQNQSTIDALGFARADSNSCENVAARIPCILIPSSRFVYGQTHISRHVSNLLGRTIVIISTRSLVITWQFARHIEHTWQIHCSHHPLNYPPSHLHPGCLIVCLSGSQPASPAFPPSPSGCPPMCSAKPLGLLPFHLIWPRSL
jgi:hypothetical protein